ncbi:MAG: GFA family protein [Pseudomonadota bacterium]
MAIEGGCECGQCRYQLGLEHLPVTYACHCLNCQTMSGSSNILQAPIPEAKLDLRGEIKIWASETPSGFDFQQRYCPTCLTRLYSTSTSRPGLALLRAGTLDDSQRLSPVMHIWTKRKQQWIALPEDVETYEEAAPIERSQALFAPNFS